jgi:hypothetical protein
MRWFEVYAIGVALVTCGSLGIAGFRTGVDGAAEDPLPAITISLLAGALWPLSIPLILGYCARAAIDCLRQS